MASVARASFNACKAPLRNGTQHQQVRWSGAMQQVKIRMKSVKNISKITKAMQMVAASKLKGAEKRMIAARPLTAALKDCFGSLEKSEENPEGVEFAPQSVCIVPITSDKGLCGGVNTQIIKMVRFKVLPELETAGVSATMVVVGDKARSIMSRNHASNLSAVMTQVFAGIPPNFSVACCIAEEALSADCDSIKVAYNVFQSAISQIPTVVNVPSYKLITDGTEEDPFQKFETEDERTEVLESFAEFNLAVSIYGAMLENNTSEIASRMAAMDNATRNANDMFDKLELKYNKARQSAITTELIEIISGAESLKG
jgi:F-type H+-transporting ATPase subunit gamma